MNNKTQRRIRKYFFSHYFCFVFFRKNNIRGNAATNNTPKEGKKIEENSRKSKGYSINFCSDENIQTIFGTKLKDFLNYRIDYNSIS
jgi:hypothetical protein